MGRMQTARKISAMATNRDGDIELQRIEHRRQSKQSSEIQVLKLMCRTAALGWDLDQLQPPATKGDEHEGRSSPHLQSVLPHNILLSREKLLDTATPPLSYGNSMAENQRSTTRHLWTIGRVIQTLCSFS